MGIFFLLAVTACQQELPVYETPECHLNFLLKEYFFGEIVEGADKVEYSFVYHGDIDRDTLWFDIQSMGFLADENRPLELCQVMLENPDSNAVAGTHYVAFDDPKYAKMLYMPARKETTRIPVVLLRDLSLKDKEVILKFTFKENDYFSVGYPDYSTITITLTDRLSKPDTWDDYYMDYLIGGTYGPVKHQFMIDVTGQTWDADFVEKISQDRDVLYYWIARIWNALQEYNQSHEEPLCESDGTPVEVKYPYTV